MPCQELVRILEHSLVQAVYHIVVYRILQHDKAVVEESLDSIVEVVIGHDAGVALFIGEADDDGAIGCGRHFGQSCDA